MSRIQEDECTGQTEPDFYDNQSKTRDQPNYKWEISKSHYYWYSR